MAKLKDLAQLIRSKNAGPFVLTFDIMFDSMQDYLRVRDSGVISQELFASLYGTPVDEVEAAEEALAASNPFSQSWPFIIGSFPRQSTIRRPIPNVIWITSPMKRAKRRSSAP